MLLPYIIIKVYAFSETSCDEFLGRRVGINDFADICENGVYLLIRQLREYPAAQER